MARRAPTPPETLPRILVLHGPNLNLLGTREPAVYGSTTLAELDHALLVRARTLGYNLDLHQSNHEGVLIDLLHAARSRCRGVLLNPGGYTHSSVALRDAVAAVALPTIEVHLSNIDAREDFRRHSLVAPVCLGRVTGLGPWSYHAALEALVAYLRTRPAA